MADAGGQPVDDPELAAPLAGGPAPTDALLGELSRRFDDLAPQGSAAWNFLAALSHLDRHFGGADDAAPLLAEARRLAAEHDDRADAAAQAAAGPPSRARRAADRTTDRVLAPLLEAWVRQVAVEAAGSAGGAPGTGTDTADGFHAAAEALRYLAARVDVLEANARVGAHPLDAEFTLVAPPDLSAWTQVIVDELTGPGAAVAGGTVCHAECGHGTLLGALAARGLAVHGVEPRADVVLAATDAGLPVHLGDAPAYLAALAPASLSAVVLSGVVDRIALPERLALLDVVVERLVPGGRVLVTGGDPDGTGFDEVARDLLGARPLHAATWAHLLGRSGFFDVGPRAGPAAAGPAGCLVVGRRSS